MTHVGHPDLLTHDALTHSQLWFFLSFSHRPSITRLLRGGLSPRA